MNLLPWCLTLQVVSSTFHSVAIACTLFRLFYRWYIACFWWEDAWAVFALAVDVLCLVATWLQVPVPDHRMLPTNKITLWMIAIAFPCVLWACRMSILLSIVRVANPSRKLRCIASLVGCSFFIMWIVLIGQKIQICIQNKCIIAASVGLSQLITDVISDLALVILPIYFLRRTNITHRQRIMIFSAFSASLLITAVTILHSAVLFTIHSSGTMVIGHVKTALSLIVCNLLVIVSFVYRMCRRGSDLDAAEEVVFTSVYLGTILTESTADKRTTIVRHSMASETSPGTSRPPTVTTEGTA